ncbi:hypothetical protein ACJROX_29610 [Pseudalkalibacillus sp. A8]|uniref:hypothetical protein n=1 Tax=Pseudalkalibacillus sp. A8 TaxID=3382641 RepID=UPI0038B4B0EF
MGGSFIHLQFFLNGNYFLIAEAENFAGTAESNDRLHVIVAGKPSPQPESEAELKEGNVVDLTWEEQNAERFVLERNGELLSEVNETSYIDETVEAGQEYTYQGTAILKNGEKVSYQPITVSTKEPHLTN